MSKNCNAGRRTSKHRLIEDKVGPFSTSPAVSSRLSIRAKGAGKIMLYRKIKRLPLTKGGRIVAMVTARDLVEAFQRGK
jgi:signal-transduction protein with cAMP-binding, CBS, and nucleotidyltransferase domain